MDQTATGHSDQLNEGNVKDQDTKTGSGPTDIVPLLSLQPLGTQLSTTAQHKQGQKTASDNLQPTDGHWQVVTFEELDHTGCKQPGRDQLYNLSATVQTHKEDIVTTLVNVEEIMETNIETSVESIKSREWAFDWDPEPSAWPWGVGETDLDLSCWGTGQSC